MADGPGGGRGGSDRPGGSRGDGPDGDGESFDWLYGDRRPADPGDTESTQVISGIGRPGGPGQPGGPGAPGSRPPSRDDGPPTTIAPTPGSPTQGSRGAPPPSARAPKQASGGRRRSPLRWVKWALVAWVVYLIVVPVFAWMSVNNVNADPKGDRPADQPGTTYLVVGSDARKGLAGRRTDTIMLLHTGSGPNLLMSIPRDSIVDIPGHGTGMKINAAFAFGGPKLLISTIENETGIRIDDYVEIGFTGFVSLVDAVGGIEICPTEAMNDPLAELDIKKGCQEADGKTALGYSRSRKTQTLGDIDRARHQREVVSAIGKEVVSWQTVVNPVRYWRVLFGGAGSVRISDGTGPITAGRFALAMTRVNGKNGLTCGVPIADLAVNWDAERAPQLFKLIAEDRTDDVGKDLCTPTGTLN